MAILLHFQGAPSVGTGDEPDAIRLAEESGDIYSKCTSIRDAMALSCMARGLLKEAIENLTQRR